MNKIKYAFIIFLAAGSAYAQAPSTAQWGINKTSSPYPVSINVNNSWAQMGTVTSGGVWSLPVGNITNSSVPLLAAANTWTNLNTVATAGPVWASYAGIWDQFAVNVNSYPMSQAFGNNTVPIASAVAGYIKIPSTAKTENHNAGVSGYAVTSAPYNVSPAGAGAVGVFGFGGVAANYTSGWGFNTVTSNGISPQPAANSGYANSILYGYELDFNIMKTAGGGNPNDAIRGIYFIGNSEVQTTNIMTAIDIDSHGYYQNPRLPWKIGFNTNDGAVTNAINLGSLSVNTGSTTQASQPITFNSYLSGVAKKATIATDGYGNIILTPQSGTGIVPYGNIYPATNGTYTIGLTGNKFAAGYFATLSANTSSSVTAAYFVSGGAGTVTAQFTNGSGTCNLIPTNTTLSCSSDRRLKSNIVDTTSALDYINSFRIRDYVLNSDKSFHTGVIAQELKVNHPEMVHMEKDGYYSVDTANIWKMVKAIQELKAKNDELAAEIAVMKKKRP